MRLTLVLLAGLALPLAAQGPVRDAAPDGAEYYPVSAYAGRMWLDPDHVDLLGLEVMQIHPNGLGARFQVGTWRESVSGGHLLVETEAGPVGAIPIVRGLTFVPAAGFMFAVGNGVAWGLHGNVGLLVEPAGRLVGRLTYGRHWYRVDQETFGLNTMTVGVGWRLGPYPPSVAVPR